MRYLVSLVCVLALGIMACSETSGTGGIAGDDGSAGAGGDGGSAGVGGGTAGNGGAGGMAGSSGTGGSMSGVFPCTEQGIRDAIAVGGGPHTFDCNGPSVVTTQAEIVIDNDVILDGEGDLIVDAPLCGRFLGDPPISLPCHRLISVTSGTTAELIGMTVAQGCTETGDGSGILNFGTLRLRETRVLDNGWMHEWSEFCDYSPCGNGGGVYNGGFLTVTDSSVSGNVARDDGAGIYNAGTVMLIRSIVSNNASLSGAAIRNTGSLTILDSSVSENDATSLLCRIPCEQGDVLSSTGSLLMINSTVSNNSANCVNGWIIWGSGTLINSTISNNRAGTFSGFHMLWDGDVISSTIAGDNAAQAEAHLIGGSVRLSNTVIANTALDPGPTCSSSSSVESGGGNVESPGDDCGLSDPTDQVNISADVLKLGPLADNGGPTETHALLSGSVAIDQIPAVDCVDADGAPLTTDQRAEPRPGGTLCDVGAFELQP